MRGPALRRDHVIAASLAGAVVVVVGYASGIGLRPGSAADAATPPPVADGGPPAPATTQPLPSGLPPSGVPAVPLPAGAPPAEPMPPMPPVPSTPGDVVVAPTPAPVPTTPPTTPPPPPPGTDVPACEPGAAQQVLDTVGGLPLLGTVTTGLGVTGPDGLGALVLGYCRAPDGALIPAAVPSTVPSGR